MGIDFGLTATVDWVKSLSTRLIRHFTMRPLFLSPQQGSGAADNPPTSWWHIPVTVTRDFMFVPKSSLNRCEVRCWVTNLVTNNVLNEGQAMPLRWRQRGQVGGTPFINLVPNKIELVPLAIRCEGDVRLNCVITSHHEDQQQGKFLEPGRYAITIQIEDQRGKKWNSTERYQLTVPEQNRSNGLFNLEIIYKQQIPTLEI